MKIISPPARLRWGAAALFLSVPVAVYEAVLISKLPWWQVSRPLLLGVGGAFFLFCLALNCAVFRLRAAAPFLIALFFAAWFGVSSGYAIYLKYPSLALVSLIASPVFFGEWYWLKTELSRSYFDPLLQWYEGAPAAIRGLTCEWTDPPEGPLQFEVSRIDTHGVSLFQRTDGFSGDLIGKRARLHLKFQFNHRDHSLEATLRLFWKRQAVGLGLQFAHLSPDERKNLSDFVEALKGEGYVS